MKQRVRENASSHVSLTSSSTVNVEGRISVTHLEWSCCFVMLVGTVSILVVCVVENIH